jgi:ABC-type sulfate transport system permease component
LACYAVWFYGVKEVMNSLRRVKSSSLFRVVTALTVRISPARHTLTYTFALLGLVIFLFITVPLLKMLLSSVAEPEIFWQTLTDRQVVEAIWLTLSCCIDSHCGGFCFWHSACLLSFQT